MRKYILLYVFFIEQIFNYVVIPFKTYHHYQKDEKKEDDEEYNSINFIQDYLNNKIYFPVEIGSPAKEVAMILTTQSSGLNIGYSICNKSEFTNLPQNYYEYKVENSSTYNLTTKNIKTYSNAIGGFKSTELFKFFSDLEKKEVYEIEDLPFIYTPKEDVFYKYEDGKICGLIGLTLYEKDTFQETYNLISLLKKMNITNNYVFSYEYEPENNEEGKIIIGEYPHIYNKNKYNEEQLRNEYAVAEHYELVWGLMFNSIYFFDEGKNKTSINDIKYARFIPELNCIRGTKSYRKAIEEEFFNYYINKSICRYDNNIMNCDANSEFKVEKFPTLYFLNKKLNYTFELDYNDLFVKKGNKYFFLMILPSSYTEHFEMGKVFLKKYFLTYDLDKRTINFYNKNIPIIKKEEIINKENSSYSIYLIISAIVLIVAACAIGFYIGIKLYEKSRNKRKNEVDEDYDYALNS